MAEQHKEQALTEEILNDARRQADRKLSRARSTAERIVKTATSKTEQIREEAVAAARDKLEHEIDRVLADVPHQEQVRTLQVKSEVVDGLFRDVLDTLKAQTGDEALATLTNLSRDAVLLLTGDAFVFELAPADADALGTRLAERVTAELAEAGRIVTIETAASAQITDGGAIVRSADGRQRVDNSFSARMRRLDQELRGRIAAILFGDSTA